MKKKTNILKSLGFLASACLVCGGGFFIGLQDEKKDIEVNSALAYTELQKHETPSCFAFSNITNNYIFIDDNEIDKNQYARLYFDLETESKATETQASFKGTYFENNQYFGYNINSIKITLNDKTIDTSFDSVQTTIDTGGSIEYPFVPQSFDMCFKLDKNAESSYFVMNGGTEKTNILALNDQGVVTVSIDYTEYVNVAKNTGETSYVLENEAINTGKKLTYSFLVLDKNEYLVNENEDAPNVSSSDFTQTASKLIGFDYNFFGSYQTNNIPSITYNPYDYELALSYTDKEKQTTRYKIVYDYVNKDYKITDLDGLEVNSPIGIKINDSTRETSLYFYDLGEYSLYYTPIFVNNTDVYKINKEIMGHKVYVYGAQNYFTVSSGNYEELKTYSNDHTSFSLSSDKTSQVSSFINDKGKTTLNDLDNSLLAELFESNEVKTNRRPIKFKSIEGVSITSSSFYHRENNTDSWIEPTSFAIGNDFTNPGQYIVELNYTYANYTDAYGDTENKIFTQYFMFEVTNNSIEFDVYTKDASLNTIELPSYNYTNKDVYVSYEDINNSYNKNISFYIVRYDYENKQYYRPNNLSQISLDSEFIPSTKNANNLYPAEKIDWTKDGELYELSSNNGELVITSNGNYGIYAFREDLENPAPRLFSIDKITDFNLSSYTVEQSAYTNNSYATKAISMLSNEPLLFSWDTTKASGAKTFGSYKKYDISEKALYDTDFYNNIFHNFLNKNFIPVEYQLEINEANWRSYDNFDYENNSKKPVTSNYSRADSGLYVFQTYDEAGNTETKIYIIDDSSPVFFSQNLQTKQISLLTGYDTLSVDSKIIWGKQKLISLSENGYMVTTLNENELYKGRTPNETESLYDINIETAFAGLLCNSDLRVDPEVTTNNPHDDANLCYLSLPNSTSRYTGYYLIIDIEDDVYFKDYYKDEYTFIQGSKYSYSYEIVSSYKLYSIKNTSNNVPLYRSTSQDILAIDEGGGLFLSIDPDATNKDLVSAYNPNDIVELTTYKVNNTTYIFEYNGRYYLFDSITNLKGKEVTLGEVTDPTTEETYKTYSGKKIGLVEFIDKEGTYVFIIRDASSTKGNNLSKESQYLSYPGAFEYATITADESRLTIGFKENDRIISLMDSSVFETEGSSKKMYFSPTNENVIYISFIPTKIKGSGENEKHIQVDKVHVDFYPFETKENTFLYTAPLNGQTNFTDYRYHTSLSAIAEFSEDLYLYTRDGASTETIELELNVENSSTTQGLYVITRTYVDEGDKFIVSPYDYQSRTSSAIVDRQNTITLPTTVSPEMTKHTITVQKIGNSAQDLISIYVTKDSINNKYLIYAPEKWEFVNLNDLKSSYNNNTDKGMLSLFSIDIIDENDKSVTVNLTDSKYFTSSKFFQDKDGTRYIIYETTSIITKITNGEISGYTIKLNSEPITATSTQSLIGGDMLVTMYSSYLVDEGTVVSIDYPRQTSQNMMLYGSGESFYTSKDTSNILKLAYSFETNKVPVSISIPKYKFTKYFEKKFTVSNGRQFVGNMVYENAGLSYYGSSLDGNTDEDKSITPYELEVEVKFYAGVGEDDNDLKLNDLSVPNKIYKSKGDVSGGDSGYLNLYEYNLNGAWGAKVNEFHESGRYIVSITQASKEIEASAYNFKTTYSFAFDIKSSKPSFDVYGGKLLKSVEDLTFFDEKKTSNGAITYYTNKNDISVVWTDTKNPLKTNIDKEKIELNLNGSNKLTLSLNKTNGTVTASDNKYSDKFKYTYNESSLTNTLEFNLKDLELNKNNRYIEITMKYEGHDANPEYYSSTTKKIIYDQTTSYDMISNLFNLIKSNNYDISLENIREYYLADGFTTTKDMNLASYNQTNTTDPIYNNYSFVVTEKFFEALQGEIKENINNVSNNNASTMAYYKPIKNYPDGYTPTSNAVDFVQGEDVTEIKDKTTFAGMENKYYEIVEKDLAGNITIYVVYVSSLDEKKTIAGEDFFQGIYYQDSKDEEPVNIQDSLLLTNKVELSGSSKLTLETMNYRGDEWQYFYVEKYNPKFGIYENYKYLTTPEKKCYQIVGTAKKDYRPIELQDIFGEETTGYKKYVYILDKTTGEYIKFAVSQSDTTSLTYTMGEVGNTAYINISLPVTDFANDNYVRAYPVSIRIDEKVDGALKNLYHCDNDPQSEENLLNSGYNYLNTFINKSDANIRVSYEDGNLRIAILNTMSDTKFNIEIVDNFGRVKKDVYLVGETKVTPVTSNGNLYSYFREIEDEVNEVYLSSNDLVFNYNQKKFIAEMFIYNGLDFEKIENIASFDTDDLKITSSSKGSIISFTATPKKNQYDILLKVNMINIDEPTSAPLMSYYLNLYNKLPTTTDDVLDPYDSYITIRNSNGIDDTNKLISIISNSNKWEEVTINGKVYKVCSSRQTFSDELRISYDAPKTLTFPFEVKYYYETENWENGNDFVPLESGARLNQNGIYYILVKYQDDHVLTKEYFVFKIEILGSTATNYFIYANGVSVNKASSYYTDISGKQHSEYYIVNINYQDRNIKEKFEIITNDYQQILAYEIPSASGSSYYKAEGSGIYTYKYVITNFNLKGTPTDSMEDSLNWGRPTEEGIEAYFHVIFITFLNPSNNILGIYDESTSGLSYKTDDSALSYVTTSTSLVKVIITDDTADIDSVTISWNKSYGIKWNKISMLVEKDGRRIDVETYENDNYYYAVLTRSGSYVLTFKDESGNVQSFYSGMSSLPFIFIKDVHFTTTYLNPITNELVHTEAINKAVYNGEVILTLNQLLIPYYQSNTFGNGNIINVTRNGEDYNDTVVYSTENYSYTFSEPGYYVLYMEAFDKESPNTQIRAEKYSFTIINAKESRYAYNFSGYKDYYVKNIVKDGIDVTDLFTDMLKTSTNIIKVKETANGKVEEKEYLKDLLISFYDEKTGSGRYQVTICSNDKLYLNDSEELASFTFEFFINARAIPIKIPVSEGGSTNKVVHIKFNAKNVYDAVGECIITVGKSTYNVNEETVEDVEMLLGDDEAKNQSYYIQVSTISGNVLYSYKITLKEPMNAWTIIAIIASVVVVLIVVLIIIKLRKKIGVK